MEELFGRYESAATVQKDTLFEAIKHELDAHALLEEELFYPAAMAVAGAEPIQGAIDEHALVKNLLGQIAHLQPEDPAYDVRVRALRDEVLHHVQEEERVLFPRVEAAFEAGAARALAERMRARRGAVMEEMAHLP